MQDLPKESKKLATFKIDPNVSHESISTSSGDFPINLVHSPSLTPRIHKHRRRANSLKDELQLTNIDFPELHSVYRSVKTPLPDCVEEDVLEDSYVYFHKLFLGRT